ncbi:MAG: helix-turn-helix domain-containing protein [Woeseiaceae bacterium]
MREIHFPTATMTRDEKAFFVALGGRLTALRKERGLTQVQLAEALGISQQHVQSFEKGRRRIPVSALAPLAEALSLSIEEVLGTPTRRTARRGPAPKLARQMARIERLPRSQQHLVTEVIEAVLARSAAG